ncbi:MAG: recombinase family protein [Phycisphaerales bacterium]|nr:recombinase family protein [Phycisphaerales bacterium]
MQELDTQRKAVGYTRCSTHEQAVSGLGLTAQAERIAAYCRLQNLTCTEIIVDPGVSGGKPLATRPGGQELLNAIRPRGIETIVTLKLDRMFRNAGDCLTTVEQWERRGVALHVIDLGGNAIDTTSAAGRFMLTVLAGAAEMERNLTRERTRSALAVKRANGQRIGTVPFCYDLAPDGRSLEPNAAEQSAVALIHTLRARRWTLEAIAEELTEHRIPTKTGRSTRWTHQAVRRILLRSC